MKPIYATLFALLMATGSLMANKITAKSNDEWNKNSTWTPTGTPATGDTIEVPSGKTVTVIGEFNLDNVVIIISGVLDLVNGKLKMNDNSRVILNGGQLIGHGNNDQIKIGSDFKFKGAGVVSGYKYADASTNG